MKLEKASSRSSSIKAIGSGAGGCIITIPQSYLPMQQNSHILMHGKFDSIYLFEYFQYSDVGKYHMFSLDPSIF